MSAVVLSASESAIKQIANALDSRENVEAVHIIAHGKPGSVNFASGPLTLDTLDDYAIDLAEIGDALGRDCALYLWSCDTGQGERGSAFVNALERATGIEVAAATGAVGAATQGGEWELTARASNPQARPPLTLEGIADYDGILGVTLDLNGAAAGTNDTSSYTEQQGSLILFTGIRQWNRLLREGRRYQRLRKSV